MDPRRKYVLGIRACSTTESMRIDRFSDLPDPVAHHILSFLAITDLTRFGCVSKRCQQLYLSSPSLNFDEFSYANVSTCNKRLQLLSYLDSFLLIDRGVNKIHHFRICWNSDLPEETVGFGFWIQNEKLRMERWIRHAVRCNVEVLHLDFSDIFYRTQLLFPSCVFGCGSLRSLLFKGLGGKILKAPSLDSFSNLEYLNLVYVIISDEGIFKWISRCCKSIKKLHLETVGGIKNVTIESSSLKSFYFKDPCDNICNLNISGEQVKEMYIDWEFDSPINKSLKIYAPNLKYLTWLGNLLTHQNLGKLMCLEKAEILLRPEADEFNIVFEVLCSISRVEVLILNKETTMALFKGGSMPAPLDNVSYLCIHIGSLLDVLVPEMVSIFGVMPNLSTLEIKSDPLFLDPKTDCSGFNMGYWKLHNLPSINQLKEVTIELSDGSNGIEFARYILEHAQNMKKLVIVHSPEQSNSLRKLNKTKRTSNATIVFQEDQQRGRRVVR